MKGMNKGDWPIEFVELERICQANLKDMKLRKFLVSNAKCSNVDACYLSRSLLIKSQNKLENGRMVHQVPCGHIDCKVSNFTLGRKVWHYLEREREREKEVYNWSNPCTLLLLFF